jgi:hypothetical protein
MLTIEVSLRVVAALAFHVDALNYGLIGATHNCYWRASTDTLVLNHRAPNAMFSRERESKRVVVCEDSPSFEVCPVLWRPNTGQ